MQPISAIRTNSFKVVLLALMVNYLFFSVGIIKATHFCMGREASVAFFSSEAEKCFCSKFLAEKDTCCDDKQEVIRIDKDQKTIAGVSIQIPDMVLLEAFDLDCLSLLFEQNQNFAASENQTGPPLKVPLFKSHCAFVFYDSILVS